MIRIEHLNKTYPNNPKPTLSDVSLSFPDTGLFYLVGKSGSGKSTLMNLLGAMDEVYQGSIRFHDKELKEMSEEEKADYRFREISFVFQSYQAEDQESVRSNLLKALAITTLSKEEKEERIQYRLKQVGLEEKEHALFKTLSGGEKKRVSLARALLKDSRILLCDEPLSSLNKGLRKKVTSILEEESKTRLVLVITHEKDEISDKATIYEIINGKIHLIHQGESKKMKSKSLSYQRKKFSGTGFLFQMLSSLKSKREFLIITIFSLMIGLFAISFSFQLSGSVSTAMEKSMSSYMDENAFVISPGDNTYQSKGFQTIDYQTLTQIQRNHEEDIIAISTFYTTSFDPVFGDNQSIKVYLNSKMLDLPKLSLDSFLEYRMIDELPNQTIYGETEINEEEVIMALDEDRMNGLYLLAFDYSPGRITPEVMERLSLQINSNPFSLRIQANKSEWGYDQDYSLKVKGLVLDESCYLIHPSSTFSNHFVSDIMHFKEVLEEEEIPEKQPWTLKKCEGFRLRRDRTAHFLKSFLQDETGNSCSLSLVRTKNYYLENDASTHNHIALVKDYLPKIHINEIQDFVRKHNRDIQSVSYSTPVYTYTASGYISGFSKPFFFSKYKEKLNQIEDSAYYSDEDLGTFQGSLIKDIPGVIKADLISSMDHKKALSLISLDSSSLKPYCGKEPSQELEVGISRRMAEELFQSATAALNKPLCTLTLDKTTKVNGRYRNHFIQGEVRISGIYENDSYAIYQDSLFPLCYCFHIGGLDSQDVRATQAVLKVDLKKHNPNYYLNEIKKIGDYDGSFPMYNMIQEIRKTLNFLSLLFLGFSILSLVSASLLLGLSLYLIISKDRKEIGILLSLGYQKKEIYHFYLTFCHVVGGIGYLLSLVVSLFCEVILKNTLMEMLDAYTFSVTPFLISFLVSYLLCSLTGLFLYLRMKDLSVKDAFSRVHQ